MGWLFSPRWANREELRTHLTSGNGLKTIKSCWKGSNLWCVHEATPESGHTVMFICLYLTQKERGGSYGYKGVPEDMGPYQTNCPLSYILMVEAHEKEHNYAPTGHTPVWRAKVRGTLLRAKRKLQVGDKIRLYDHEYTIGMVLGRRGYLIQDSMYSFRMKLNQVKDVEVLAWHIKKWKACAQST